MSESSDGVSNIHNRFSLTLINPSSHYFSLVASLAIAVAIAATVYFGYLRSDGIWFAGIAIVAVLAATQLLDTQFTRKKEYSKSLHLSLFANMLWWIVLAMGLLASIILSKEPSLFFIALGMFLSASFRIGIYTTTLGINIKKAWAICLVQPLPMFLTLVPPEQWLAILADPIAVGYGIVFLIMASVWSRLTDKAGKPELDSTHRTVQAYIASQGNDYAEVESIFEQHCSSTTVTTSQIRLRSEKDGREFRMVLPDVHPGPFHPVGGSNIPYLIYKNMDSSAMVMHSISDHALNLPSKNQVEGYLNNLSNSNVSAEGLTCTEPVTVQINKSRVTGLLFGDNPLLFLSLSPHGMEDIPSYVRTEIEQYAKNRNYSKAMIVDCHNAMGSEISKEDAEDILKATKSCLDSLITKDSFSIEFGYANSDDMDIWAEDLGMGGLGMICLKINGKRYFIGWADANNMENGVREKIVDSFTDKGYKLLEICTSDTHYAPVKARNKNGYYQLGLITDTDKLAGWMMHIAGMADAKTSTAKYEILENETDVKIMGHGIFEYYSKALDNALRITKIFGIGGIILFATTLFL